MRRGEFGAQAPRVGGMGEKPAGLFGVSAGSHVSGIGDQWHIYTLTLPLA
jgi:hypothetical protein